MTFYVATGNRGKLSEIVEILRMKFPNISDFKGRAAQEAEETEDTFQGNAEIKSLALARELLEEGEQDFWVLSDDSGLEVEALGGAPGVISARYAGDHVEPIQHIEKLLKELEPFLEREQRKARYVCGLSLLQYSGAKELSRNYAEGYCEGYIAHELKGLSGFGYDPIFWVPQYKCHMAELSNDVKNAISHRMDAFEKLLPESL